MNFFRTVIAASALTLPLLFAAGTAQATVIKGSSEGSFSNISSCWGTCYVFKGANGPDTSLEWGFGLFTNGSTLVAQDRAWNVDAGDANDVILAELVWTNRATSDWITPDNFKVNYTLNIQFSQPNATRDTEVFNFSIANAGNPAGDKLRGLTLGDLAGLSFSLNGIEMSDLKYQLAAGSAGAFDGTAWSNPEGKTSRMYITADFKAAASQPGEPELVNVPEPGSLALLASGLAGLGFLRRRKQGRD